MLETKITLLATADILEPPERQRFKLDKDHANDLAQSIASNDLINPIIVDSDSGAYIAGQHRLEAFRINEFLQRPCPRPEYIGWTHIPVRLGSNLTPEDLTVIELIENIHAKKMDWKEVALAVEKLQSFQPEGEATLKHVAELLSSNEMHVSNCLRAAKYIHQKDELVLAATSLTGAMNVIGRKEERTLNELSETIRTGITIDDVEDQSSDSLLNSLSERPTGSLEREPGEKCATEVRINLDRFQAVEADFIEWASTYSGPRFNLIHCDFPYGINYDKSGFDYAKHHNIYGDSKDLYFALLGTLVDRVETLCATSAHLIFWYDARYRAETIDLLSSAGFTVWPHHLIWHKSDNAGVLADYRRGPRHTHETALFASRGDRKIVKPVADSFTAPTTRDSGHVSEKPLEVLRHFYNLVVDDTTRILDPTAGSFNSILAAKQAGARSGVGIELDRGYAQRGNRILMAPETSEE